MPRLLLLDTLDGPPVRARWTAILAVAAVITASVADWAAAWDATRGFVPTTSDRFEWTAADLETTFDAAAFPGDFEGIADPAAARTAQLRAKGMLLDLVWDPTLTVVNIRVEVYEDGLGTGHRLAIAMDSTTADGLGCLNASLSPAAAVTSDRTTLQVCSRADRHPALHQEPDKWYPDHLFITQTANLDPADLPSATLVDYYGLGLDIGDPEATGIWGPNWWSPMMGDLYRDCDDTDRYADLDDMHLRPEYGSPTAHEGSPGTFTHGPARAEPQPGSLIAPACIPIDEAPVNQTGHRIATEPFQKATPTALAGWTRYNAAKTEPAPLRTALILDIRSCDSEPAQCTGDDAIAHQTANSGTGGEWMTELLDR